MAYEKLTATFEVTTPMIMAGFPQRTCELRFPSFKGALRYWWRALAWGKVRSVQELKRQEDELFGSTNNGQRLVGRLQGQPNRPSDQSASTVCKRFSFIAPKTFLEQRMAMPAPFKFSVELIAQRQGAFTGGEVPLVSAVEALGLLGGMGYRSRKGLGSLSLKRLEVNDTIKSTPKTFDEYKTTIRTLVENFAHGDQPPPYSAMNAETQVHILASASSPDRLLEKLSSKMKEFCDTNSGIGLPPKIEFGLPRGEHWKAVGHERRGSPVVFHVHRLENAKYALVATLLPGEFLPSRKVKKKNDIFTIPDGFESYSSVRTFLNGPTFSSREMVFGK